MAVLHLTEALCCLHCMPHFLWGGVCFCSGVFAIQGAVPFSDSSGTFIGAAVYIGYSGATSLQCFWHGMLSSLCVWCRVWWASPPTQCWPMALLAWPPLPPPLQLWRGLSSTRCVMKLWSLLVRACSRFSQGSLPFVTPLMDLRSVPAHTVWQFC